MQNRHSNSKLYFGEQGITTLKYVIPYIENVMPVNEKTEVLEIGCGEAGNLVPFIEMGCPVTGIDISEERINNAKSFISQILPESNPRFICEDIYNVDPQVVGKFDLIILRDVIEHIPNQEKFMNILKKFLKPEGHVFFGFPPWRMPFGGHQQICKSKFLSKLPFFHLLPKDLYRWILKIFGENEGKINLLMELRDTGISINRFNNIVKSQDFRFAKQTLYFINPNYQTKFGLKPRKLNPLIGSIPYLRDFFTTCYYSLIRL